MIRQSCVAEDVRVVPVVDAPLQLFEISVPEGTARVAARAARGRRACVRRLGGRCSGRCPETCFGGVPGLAPDSLVAVSQPMTNWEQNLRADLARNAERFADAHGLTAYRSRGKTILFPSHGLRHGNFIDASYRAILGNRSWARRLEKRHNRPDALPEDRRHDAMELDSSNSSDALLMNCFCYPGSCTRIFSSLLPGLTNGPVEFGVPGRVPLSDGQPDRTELDMRAGTVIFESKLTEDGFGSTEKKSMERYRDLNSVFDVRLLPTEDRRLLHYQLLRNVLAAAAHGYHFVLLCDARRPDLLHSWWDVHGAIRSADLRSRSRFLLWQEVTDACPGPLRDFLHEKYGFGGPATASFDPDP